MGFVWAILDATHSIVYIHKGALVFVIQTRRNVTMCDKLNSVHTCTWFMAYCRDCGKAIEDDWVTCPYCSKSVDIVSKSSNNSTFPQTFDMYLYGIIFILCILLFNGKGLTDTSLFDLLSIDCQFFAVLGPDEVSSCKSAQNKAKLYLLCLIMSGGLALLRYINKDLINENHKSNKKETIPITEQTEGKARTTRVQKAVPKSNNSVQSNDEKVQMGCPVCARQLSVAASYSGIIGCPHCSSRFDVISSDELDEVTVI